MAKSNKEVHVAVHEGDVVAFCDKPEPVLGLLNRLGEDVSIEMFSLRGSSGNVIIEMTHPATDTEGGTALHLELSDFFRLFFRGRKGLENLLDGSVRKGRLIIPPSGIEAIGNLVDTATVN